VVAPLIKAQRRTRYGWSLESLIQKNPPVDIRKTYFVLHRFADDIVVFVYTRDAVSLALKQLEEFLTPRDASFEIICRKNKNS